MLRIFKILSPALLLALAGAAAGEPGDSGPRLISTTGGGGDSRAWPSFAALKKAADSGDSTALLELGEMYLDGSPDTPRSTAQALLYLERAAALGSPGANFRLGKLHADGAGGVPQDLSKAHGYYMAAARAGNPVAQHNVGAMIASGRGVRRDYAEGLAWLILAAKKNPEAAAGEKKLRYFLAKHPETIAAGEARAAALARELAGKPAAMPAAPAPEAPAKKPPPKIEIAPIQITPERMPAPPPALPPG